MGFIPGLAVVIAIAIVATLLGDLVPVIGGPVFGIVIGMAVTAVVGPKASMAKGIAFSSKVILQATVVLLGTGLSLAEVASTGLGSLPVMLGTMAAALIGASLFGRLLGVRGTLTTLIGVGTGICGASAIAAVSPVMNAGDADIAYSITTIFLFNVIAVLFYPTLGHLFGFSQSAFGLWAGTAINDTSSVVAAAFTFGQAAGNYAVIVKLTRTTLIIPIALALAFWRVARERRARQHTRGQAANRLPWKRIVPWFVLWFLLAAVANTLGLFSSTEIHALSKLALFFIVMALAAIGLSTPFSEIKGTGPRPVLLGALLWATVGLSSIGLQSLFGLL